MNVTADLIKLYCINIQCGKSVYNDIGEVTVGLTEKNILATHICLGCLGPLVSAVDLQMEEMLANAAIKLPIQCGEKNEK